MKKKNLVISGINLFEGGPLSVYKDCLNSIIDSGYDKSYNILIFVHKKELFSEFSDKIEIVELPKSRRNYIFRLWYEYFYFYLFSKKRDIDVWISLHDITPNVRTKHLYTYCHNSTPFLKTEFNKIIYGAKTVAFSLFYKYLYRINIKKNDALIVQQNWIRKEFLKIYPVSEIIVARPSITIEKIPIRHTEDYNLYTFIYPSYPRYFKNFEVICNACKQLEEKSIKSFQVVLTIDGSENRYSKMLVQKYSSLTTIKWIGVQKREEIFSLYNSSDCLIFPSKLETWGLPISEFKQTQKPMLVSDLAYAHETVGTYEKVCFFDPNSADNLAQLIKNELSMKNVYSSQKAKPIEEPYADSWVSLLDIILKA
jgi:glycosyltransferase involved in cell wall biosynthesis